MTRSAPHMSVMGKREFRHVATVVRTVGDHSASGPRGVEAQSCASTSAWSSVRVVPGSNSASPLSTAPPPDRAAAHRAGARSPRSRADRPTSRRGLRTVSGTGRPCSRPDLREVARRNAVDRPDAVVAAGEKVPVQRSPGARPAWSTSSPALAGSPCMRAHDAQQKKTPSASTPCRSPSRHSARTPAPSRGSRTRSCRTCAPRRRRAPRS